ncbi:DUF6090 family protein [Psychroserpens jangbogonensis]|uniref:DUF6090 family protein n=1 Tax=Psychroserpens jangbogonensis TaxID=1484460 RepID=UPI00068BBC0E|nr:DUF6090 family protein [Psychroserpens jangbogonensis]
MENKTGKYFKYAIGEIVLVVIGILIALQINNWNESKQDQIQLKSSLEFVKQNLNEDIKNLNKQIEYNENIQKAIDISFRIIFLPEDENYTLDQIGNIVKEREFYAVKTAFKSMETGAHFKWINDQNLIEAIYLYYTDTDKMSKMVEYNNKFARDKIEDFVYDEWELGTYFSDLNPYDDKRIPRIDNTKVIKESIVFENLLLGRKSKTFSEIRWSKRAINDATKLINQIEVYLIEQNK